MTKADDALNDRDNSVRRRTPGDFMRSGDGSPWAWDGVARKKDGDPKKKRAGRSSSAGHGLGGSSFGLQRHAEVHSFKAAALMMGEAQRQLGPHVELWDLTEDRVRQTINSLLVEGQKRAGMWVKADRGTLTHLVLERVALDIIDGGDGVVALTDLYPQAEALGMSGELLEAAGEIFREFFGTIATPLASEMKVINPEYNLAGTADLVLRLRVDLTDSLTAGKSVGADLKTGMVGDLTAVGQCAQLAAYFGESGLPYHINDEEETDDIGAPVEWPWSVDTEEALVLHMPISDALKVGDLQLRLVVADLVHGEAALRLSAEANGFKVPGGLIPVDGTPLRRQVSTSELTENLVKSLAAARVDESLEWLLQRLQVISESPQALALLREMWPDDVSPTAIKDGTLDPDHVTPIGRLLGHVEAEFSLPFPTTDPRSTKSGSKP